jgi:hypothetical protein
MNNFYVANTGVVRAQEVLQAWITTPGNTDFDGVLAAPFISRLIFKDQKRTLVRLDKISETAVLQDLSRYKRNFETDSGLQTRINAKVLRDPEARTRHYHVTTVVK